MEIRLNCTDKGCHECCVETEMQLSERDLKRIESLGYDRNDFSVEVDGVRILRNIDGKCLFLKDGQCSIYDSRPLGCRLYPVVYDVDKKRAVVHDFCPSAAEIPVSKIKRVERTLIKHIKDIYGFIP
ncbi:YkgJ family cysteine cluster protein [Geoglobus acetivorans]|uniref:YkgJ family cysteine cluster protein n=1 Tax=Geoglobus acetivorans TaxID=565033 RepID=A0ABZ3H270_GEOAI|nr:YkgJ family cysteine cluster protein [Geoglobus acetivorans]